MSILMQLTLASILMTICLVVHVAVLSGSVQLLRRNRHRLETMASAYRNVWLIGVSLFAVVIATTIGVWLWAICVIGVGALGTFEDALYFALATYTTLGYGDILLTPAFRIFGAFASVAGLLAFGLSTAFLVGIFTRLLPRELTAP